MEDIRETGKEFGLSSKQKGTPLADFREVTGSDLQVLNSLWLLCEE